MTPPVRRRDVPLPFARGGEEPLRQPVQQIELTTLLESARRGDGAAVGRLFELLYADLRRIAHARLRESNGVTLLDTTSLVHEAYLRLERLERLRVDDRPHFLAYAARAMRSVVVDFARQKLAERRGGDRVLITLNTGAAEAATSDDADIVRVHEALQELGKIDARLEHVVEMRYFAGLPETEIAAALGVSTRTIERDWEKARIFLFASLK